MLYNHDSLPQKIYVIYSKGQSSNCDNLLHTRYGGCDGGAPEAIWQLAEGGGLMSFWKLWQVCYTLLKQH